MKKSTLDSMTTGLEVTIDSLSGDENYVQRLYELGLSPGKKVKVSSRVLWGEPLIVETESISIALRRSEARCVVVLC